MNISFEPTDMQSSSQSPGSGLELQKQLKSLVRVNRMKMMKLERLKRYNERLKESLQVDRIKASNSSLIIIDYTERTKDFLLPSIWGKPEMNRFNAPKKTRPKQSSQCCVIM